MINILTPATPQTPSPRQHALHRAPFDAADDSPVPSRPDAILGTTMERFKAETAARYVPKVCVQSTLDCDAVIRTVSDEHRTLISLLTASISTHSKLALQFQPASHFAPTIWADASRKLDTTLRASVATRNSTTLLAAYAHALESVTAITDHDHLSAPPLVLLAVWVGQTNLLRTLSSLAANSLVQASAPPHVLLVQRADSRQDLSAADAALSSVRAAYGDDQVHMLVLRSDELHSAASFTKLVVQIVAHRLASLVDQIAHDVDRLRRASRSTFRGWLSANITGVPVRKPQLQSDADTFSSAAVDQPPSQIAMEHTPHANQAVSEVRQRRRVSVGSAGVPTPQFASDSLEALTRRLADLYMLSARYNDAMDTYRLLQYDLRSLTGAALVHEAAALEMYALSLALVDGSKQGVGNALENAIDTYSRAGRRELAVRAAIRAISFCNEAGFPDSAAGVIIRAVDAMQPGKYSVFPLTNSAAPNSFLEAAIAILYTSCSEAYAALKKRRRSSLYAFLAAARFSKVKLNAAAACIGRNVDESALLRSSVRDNLEVMFGVAELSQENYARAAAHFVQVMSTTDETMDVELQSSAIQGFLSAVVKGALTSMEKRWDAGAMFPLVEKNLTRMETYDSRTGSDRAWDSLEDDVLEDCEYFGLLRKSTSETPPKREKRVETAIAMLRKKRERGDRNDPGGSLEMKIKRMRDVADSKRKQRKSQSLLERGAVVGELVVLHVTLRNPLQFPVFVNNLTAVVLLDGQCFTSVTSRSGEEDKISEQDCSVEFIPTDDVTLGPCSSHNVAIKVKPLRSGNLQFIGLSWRFTVGIGGVPQQATSPGAPGFGLLERRGRRLNDTRRQRASETPMYVKDDSLLLRLVPAAPKISALLKCRSNAGSLEEVNDFNLSAGEKREGRLIIKNEGQVPLEDVVIRIGTPQTIFIDVGELVNNGTDNGIYAIGMDDTLVQRGEPIVAAWIRLPLQPGEVTELVVWLKAAVSNNAFSQRSSLNANVKNQKNGKGAESDANTVTCSVRVALAYGLERSRICRVNARFRVKPSVKVSPRFIREVDRDVLQDGSNKYKGILLGLEVEHGSLNSVENDSYEVTHITVTSRMGWKPVLLPAPDIPDNHAEDEISPSACFLRANETATVFAMIVLEEDIYSSFKKTNALDQAEWQTETISMSKKWRGELQGSDSTQSSNEHSNLHSKHTRSLSSQASSHYVICSNQSSQMLHNLPSRRVKEVAYVAVSWRSTRGISGDMYIPPVEPLQWISTHRYSIPTHGPVAPILDLTGMNDTLSHESLPAIEEKANNLPLEVKVIHAKSIEHDFFGVGQNSSHSTEQEAPITGLPAIVPVDVYVKNVSQDLMDVSFVASPGGGVADGDRGRFWAGDVSISLNPLPPGAERNVCLTAVLSSPGRYNLSKFVILYQLSSEGRSKGQQRFDVDSSFISVTSTTSWNSHVSDSSPAAMPDKNISEVSAGNLKEEVRAMNAPIDNTYGVTNAVEGNNFEGTHDSDSKSNVISPSAVNSASLEVTSSKPRSSSDSSEIASPDANDGRKSTRNNRIRVNGNYVLQSESTTPKANIESASRRVSRSLSDSVWNASDTDDSQ